MICSTNNARKRTAHHIAKARRELKHVLYEITRHGRPNRSTIGVVENTRKLVLQLELLRDDLLREVKRYSC